MISVDAALREIFSHGIQLATERVSLAIALDRLLREDARADRDAPPFDASAMDGYALRRADAGQPLRLVGASQAGGAFAGTIGAGECVRIFTGAPVPAGADCVVRQEDATADGDTVKVTVGPDYIRRRGENRRSGEVVVPAGARLGPAELAALASVGVHLPLVSRRPRCVHLVTGDELVSPDQTPVGAQIRDSNSILIASLLAQNGSELVGHGHARDTLAEAQAAVAAFPAHDVLLISGGASVGDHDFARPVLTALGYTLHFQQVNLRPGKPLVFASRGRQLAFALPGNPVSHWVTFNLFVAPLLGKLATGQGAAPVRQWGTLDPAAPLPLADSRHTLWPCRVQVVDGRPLVTPLALRSSGDSSGLVGANALLPLPANGLDPARPVEFIGCP